MYYRNLLFLVALYTLVSCQDAPKTNSNTNDSGTHFTGSFNFAKLLFDSSKNSSELAINSLTTNYSQSKNNDTLYKNAISYEILLNRIIKDTMHYYNADYPGGKLISNLNNITRVRFNQNPMIEVAFIPGKDSSESEIWIGDTCLSFNHVLIERLSFIKYHGTKYLVMFYTTYSSTTSQVIDVLLYNISTRKFHRLGSNFPSMKTFYLDNGRLNYLSMNCQNNIYTYFPLSISGDSILRKSNNYIQFGIVFMGLIEPDTLHSHWNWHKN